MKILVIDRYNNPRDLAQMDMYMALLDKYELIFANSNNIMDYINKGEYDYLYLGIYHPWCGIKDLESLINENTKPTIIDQADNENFIARKKSKVIYKENSILLSRYLPNKNLEKFWNGKLMLLPWYINPDRFIPKEKEIDISFVCAINIRRLGADRKKMSVDILNYCNENNFTYKIGEDFKNYSNIITKTKAMIVDGSRYCLTQKYIEAALSECLIIGEKPLSPPNDFITLELKNIDYKNLDRLYSSSIISRNKKYVLETYSNKEKFLNNFDNIIKEFK